MITPDLLIDPMSAERASASGSRFDLTRFLYSGSASLRSNVAYQKIAAEQLGSPQASRLELLVAIKEELEGRLHSGQSAQSLPHYITTLVGFIRFLDDNNLSFELSSLEENFLEYAEFLFVRHKTKGSGLSQNSAYLKAAILSTIFGSILSIPETVRLVNRTRLRSKKVSVKAASSRAEKQSLESTFRQGNLLTDIAAGLSKESVYGTLPLIIKVREGLIESREIYLYAGLLEMEWDSATSMSEWSVSEKVRYRKALKRREAVSYIAPRKGGARRWLLVNLRVQAEFLIFVAQTGMNLTQAKQLGRGALKYKSLGDS